MEEIRARTDGRGADAVLVAVPFPALVAEALAAARPCGRILLFAHNDPQLKLEFPSAAVGIDEKEILGSYSADVDMQEESADLVFSRKLPVAQLITHRFPLEEFAQGLELAARPTKDSLKVIILPSYERGATNRNGRMTAAVLYGSEDLKIEEIEIPQIAADEVLVRVKVALTGGTDLKVWRRGYHARMITPPAVFGHELAGESSRWAPP